jgi:hypothetical protein
LLSEDRKVHDALLVHAGCYHSVLDASVGVPFTR